MSRGRNAVVLGAGLQGVLAALMLARRGYEVKLVERRLRIMDGASLNYEGRIHLGLIYALDRDFATGARMATDAMNFASVIERLVGRTLDWQALCSTPTSYLVHAQSHLSADEMMAHFQKIEGAIHKAMREEGLSYLGQPILSVARRVDIPEGLCRKTITACFETAELCLDQVAMRDILDGAITRMPNIEVFLGHSVEHIKQVRKGTWAVTCLDGKGRADSLEAPLVVNCLWEERAIFDRQAGLKDDATESMRLKFSLRVRTNAVIDRLGSFLIVHGAFGSIVTLPGTSDAFLSWYPASLHGLLPVQKLPASWAAICAGRIDPALARKVWQENLKGFGQIIPELGAPELTLIKGGVILAKGLRDIDRVDSAFHRRDDPPIRIQDGYVSVSTGKYTSAPRNTKILEGLLFGYPPKLSVS